MNTPPEIIAGRYRVLRELGRGGMGVVYLVEHLGTGDQLALKVLLNHTGASAEMVERFKREAKAPARIKSENVVRVTDTDVAPELDGAPFIVMELLNGHDLEKTLAQRQLAASEVVSFLRQAARALDKAHALGITHRDLKPENLFLHRREDGEEVVKILDFGISKLTGDGNDIANAGLTKSGAMMGTPLYMSPEQARGRTGEVGPPTDIWAMGLIAFRLLTGTIYWQAQTLAELMVQIISEPMRPPSVVYPGLPEGFDAWFARSTDRVPSQRFASVGEQIEALASLFGILSFGVSRAPSMSLPSFQPATTAVAPVLGHATSANLARSRLGNTSAEGGGRRGLLWLGLFALGALGVGGFAVFRSTGASSASAPAEPAPATAVKKVDPKPIVTAPDDTPVGSVVIAKTVTPAAPPPPPAKASASADAGPPAPKAKPVEPAIEAKPEPKPDPKPEPKPAAPPPVVDSKKFDPTAP